MFLLRAGCLVLSIELRKQGSLNNFFSKVSPQNNDKKIELCHGKTPTEVKISFCVKKLDL